MSTRIAKQIIYGAFYAIFWSLVIWAGYAIFVHPVASCFDHIQNQGETGVDCGGPCSMVCTGSTQPIAVLGVNAFASGAGHDTFLAQIENPNGNFAAQSFAYAFNVYDASGMLLQSYPAQSFIYGSQLKYLFLVNQPIPSSTVSVNLTIPTSTTMWIASSTFGASPQLAVQNISTQIGTSTAIAGGQLVDQDTAGFNNIFIIAIFKNAQGNPIGASQTELDSISPGQTENFSVSYPAIAGINPSATEVEAYAER